MLDALQARIEQEIAASGAQIGVAIRHIESGATLMIDADQPVPLASVVKIPVLVEAFRQLRAGRFHLDDRWTLRHEFKALGSGILTQFDDGLTPTVRDLLTLMIIISDNTATDILFDRLGIDAINAHMHELGLTHTHVAQTLTAIFKDMLPSPDPDQDRHALARWEAEHGVRRDGFAYSLGPDNNVSTPRDMTRLVELIFKAEILDREACDAMLDIMLKQQLNDRLPRFLPPEPASRTKPGRSAACAMIVVSSTPARTATSPSPRSRPGTTTRCAATAWRRGGAASRSTPRWA
ncbi:MAG: class A beta-lactamase-related serine hydrolase [Anaerolineae bacterium]|nr:class A beta-lactamase-related serine hydrolase [Anaerolineae bacterium]